MTTPTIHCIYQIVFDAEVTDVRRSRENGPSGSPQLELLVRHGGCSRGATVAPDAISCDYVIAADGAGSSVRAAAGMGLTGRRELGHLVNIHFRCRGLGRLLRAKGQRPGMLYFVYNEVREGFTVDVVQALGRCTARHETARDGTDCCC